MLRSTGVEPIPSRPLGGSNEEALRLPQPLETLRAGALNTITGGRSSGKTTLALTALAAATREGRSAALVDATGWIFPPALALMQATLERVLFLRARGKLSVWAAEQVLSSGLFDVVLLVEPARVDGAALRRLQLAAERSEALALLVTSRAEARPGLVATRLRAEAVPPAREALWAPEDRSPVASPPRRCRARISTRGGGAPRTEELLLADRRLLPSGGSARGPRRPAATGSE